jgi:diguanylate cyclase
MALLGLPMLVGLLIESIGVLLIAVLSLALRNTLRREPLDYWSVGWWALFVALLSLFIASTFPVLRVPLQPVYIFGEYVFGYLVIVGCRLHISGERPQHREAWLLLPGFLIALALPVVGAHQFSVFGAVHTLICAYLFLAAFRTLWRSRANRGSSVGVRVMKIALLLLTLDSFHYAPLYAASSYGFESIAARYLEYGPLYDLIFLVLLAFGMVMVATGEVQHELEAVNARLARTRDRLEAMVQLDHLTSALNRHAFYSILGDSQGRGRVVFRGCAAVADIDNLKTLNDRHGHAAGDIAIRAVASALRACIRADDLLFRWGGDEFLVLVIGVSEGDARARLDGVNDRLRRLEISGADRPVDVSVSLGYAPFDSAAALEDVIVQADSAMYDRKRTGTALPTLL